MAQMYFCSFLHCINGAAVVLSLRLFLDPSLVVELSYGRLWVCIGCWNSIARIQQDARSKDQVEQDQASFLPIQTIMRVRLVG